MKPDIKKVLDQHAIWLKADGETGERANLSEANLIEAYLSRANLSEAYLSGAIFDHVNFDNCKGVKVLLVDPRTEKGYILIRWLLDSQPMYTSGCRCFTRDEAIDHWGSDKYEDRERGMLYCEAIVTNE